MELRKRLLLTGGAIGIGRAVAIAPPDSVVVADVNAADAERTVAAVVAAGGTAHLVRCDITSEEEVRALIATTEELIGGIDALVTAAGVLQAATVPVEQIDPADWTRTLEVKYVASKGGVYGLSKALTPRLAEDGIRVNLLLPGNVDTPLKHRAEEAMNASGRPRNPVLAEPAGVARVVRFLLSDGRTTSAATCSRGDDAGGSRLGGRARAEAILSGFCRQG